MILPTKRVSSLLALSVCLGLLHGNASANIIAVLTQSTADGFVGVGGSEENAGESIDLSDKRINASFGNEEYGSASRFDSISDLEGDNILFMNANSSYGFASFSESKTVVDVSYQNTSSETVRPVLQSQILAASMGFYLSDCSAVNLLNCGSSDDPIYGFDDITGPLTEFGIVSSQFDFRVQAGDEVLYSLSGSVTLNIEDGEPNTIVQDFGDAGSILNNFRQSSPMGSPHELTFDWDATNFEVLFPIDLTLAPGEIGTVSYITEVKTEVVASCNSGYCPVAYGAFGDPIGRGGTSRPQPRVTGYEPGLYELEASFDNEVLSLLATSGPNIPATSVPSPAPLTLLMLGSAFVLLRRMQQAK